MNCDKTPKPFVDCCTVMDCVDIKSSDNSVTVETNECGVDITLTGNNLDKALLINDGECVSYTKEFIDGKLVLTPVIDWDCVALQVCNICQPADCPAPLDLQVIET